MNLEQHNGLWVRPGTYDTYVIGEQAKSYGHLDYDGQVVMDIGANIGASAAYFSEQGASKIVCYEPLPENFEICVRNCDTLEARTVCKMAAVGAEKGTADIFVAPNRKNFGNTSLKITGGRDNVGSTEVLSFMDEVEKHQPDIIKIDCEGGEYDFLPCDLPDCVTGVTMELHRGKKLWREQSIPAIFQMFSSWELVHESGSNEGNAWTMLRTWRR